MTHKFLTVVGLLFIFEGLPYFLFPERAREYLKQLSALHGETLRNVGLLLMALGLVIVYLSRRVL